MPPVRFTGHRYAGADGATPLGCTQPGHYEVSAEKAAQLVADFPQEFSPVLEGQVKEDATKTEKAAKTDETGEQASEPSQDEQAPAEAPAEPEKPSKKK